MAINDIFSDQNPGQEQNTNNNSSDTEYLKRIAELLEEMMKDGRTFSQSNARTYEGKAPFRDKYQEYVGRRRGSGRSRYPIGSFADAFENSIMESILGKGYRDSMSKAVQGFADAFGLDLENIEEQLGKALGDQTVAFIKSTKLGQKAYEHIDKLKDKAVGHAADLFKQGVGKFDAKNGTDYASKFTDFIKNFSSSSASSASSSSSAAAAAEAAESAAATEAGMAASAETAGTAMAGAAVSAEGAGAAMAGLTEVAASVCPYIIAIVVLLKLIAPAIEGAKKMFDALKKAGTRYKDMQEKSTQLAKKRMEADIATVIEEPFKILEQAANAVYETWDSALRKINATQGYNKEDLQSLMASFAQRLREENLSDVISATDITQSLARILDAGLSGPVAEEFAYMASKLNAAVPTQDFYQYADVYASIAANAMRAGKSQTEALSYANEQLYSFASDILYASRVVSGGFTTGLKDATTLFQQGTRIAAASKTGSPSDIAGVLATVSSVVGSIAPDLASSMTDAVYKAAVGGNSSELVALRSLANINASNTEFLKKLANDPQAVFSTIFSNLSKMQGMAPEAWMEVAEGLSSVFGLQMDAFARIDFNYLAEAISKMNLNNGSLEENMALLTSGQTTLTQEQLKTRQINKYIIEEGLAYVLDNEAARAVQQHMWEEQLAMKMMEAEYGVNIQGAALEFLYGIRRAVDNILNFLNPLGFMTKLAMNTLEGIKESNQQQKDIQKVLELGKVGSGNLNSLYQLVTRGTDLNITSQLVELLGGVSSYQSKSKSHYGTLLSQGLDAIERYVWDSAFNRGHSGTPTRAKLSSPSSQYSWGILSKSAALAASGQSMNASSLQAILAGNSRENEEAAAQEALANRFRKMLEESYFRSFAEAGDLTYEDWVGSAKNFGISDFEKAMKAAGMNEEELRAYFNQAATEAASKEARRREKKEEELWDATFEFQPAVEALMERANELTEGTNNRIDTTNELISTTNMKLIAILEVEQEYLQQWTDYYINFKYYEKSQVDYSKVNEIRDKEKKEKDGAIYALAEALSQNAVDLRDPAVQTNALLSQILIVVNAIMQQNNVPGSNTLLGSLAGLAMGGDSSSIAAATSVR